MTSWCLLIGLCCGGASDAPLTAAALAERIDEHVESRIAADGAATAPLADDAEFLRRVHLDLVGRIPTEAETREFLADASATKRADTIDRLLADPRHFEHFARTWRALLLPEAETDLQVDYFRPGLEAWLRERREKNAGFDAIVRELISVPIADSKTSPEMVLRDLRRPNVLGYFAAKDAKPENLAANTTRLFLGVRLECAQCHDHPFDHWTQQQFWNQAAFFAGLERQGRGVFAPLTEARGLREIALMQTDERTPALYLDGATPSVATNASARAAFADWLTSGQNTQFAHASVNRVWGQMLGIGLVDPVDDFQESNPPSHPELLDEVATAFIDSGFDLTLLTGAICRTRTYQRTSRLSDESQQDGRLFAKMSVKQMTGEQFVESLLSALGMPREDDPLRVGRNRDPLQQQLLDVFSAPDRHSDPQTSILQALALMNGSFVNAATAGQQSPTLAALIERRDEPIESKIDSLYLTTLNRFSIESERARLVQYLGEGTPEELPVRLGDALWMLINSVEFRCNH